ncbi:hypothetical protein COCCU_06485 [Corynebacterium occultum]|uniref:Secreted protein n=1 Tax=Corynebacterium occultum TaxID=2675219 RepID=A0A6B8W7F9_9CORY|nr:hypothetical protein [Corynebacterium occultum]QGU07235.1 hypothetical protein COCCU_06485 [Corynebacterium occultum]
MRSTRPYLIFSVSLLAATTLSGCTSSGESTQVTSYVTETLTSAADEGSSQDMATGASEPSGAAPSVNAVVGAYSAVLDNPGQYSYTGGADYPLNGEYQYALVEMTGGGFPELLVQAMSAEHINPIRVFSTTDDGTLASPQDTLVSGAAGAGGYRAGIFGAPEGNRLFQAEWHSVQPGMSIRGFVLQGDRLVSNGEEWEDDQLAPSDALATITFHPLNNRGPLETMTSGAGTGNASSGVEANAGAPSPTLAPSASTGNTAAGTVRVLTAPELAQLQGHAQTPNGEGPEHRFAMFIFDSPTAFTAKASGDRGALQEREASMVLIGSHTPHTSNAIGFDLEGQHLTLSFDQNGCWFPSDASLPLGQPRCSDFTQQ